MLLPGLAPAPRGNPQCGPGPTGTIPPMTLTDRLGAIAPKVWLRVSIAVAILTIGLKTLAWWITGSVGLLSDAMESVVNLASAAFALLMVHVAQQPPDAEHPYGHHKAEYFSSAFE